MDLIYKKVGWGYLGYTWPFGWQVSWPFAIFELYDDKIILKLFPFKKEIMLNELDYIKVGHFIPVRIGIKIIHHEKGADNLQFGCFNRGEIINILEQKGIRISK